MPNIRIDRDVYEALQKDAEPFVDSPNTVLRRLLGLDPLVNGRGVEQGTAKTDPRRGSTPRRSTAAPSKLANARAKTPRPTRERAPSRVRASSDEILPESEYVGPLLDVLAEKGGSAHAREVVEEVGKRLGSRLTAVDKERLASGGIRWQNRIQFVRLGLAEEGIIERNSRRGVWALTDSGMARAKGEVA